MIPPHAYMDKIDLSTSVDKSDWSIVCEGIVLGTTCINLLACRTLL